MAFDKLRHAVAKGYVFRQSLHGSHVIADGKNEVRAGFPSMERGQGVQIGVAICAR